jgi:hypothetical protein
VSASQLLLLLLLFSLFVFLMETDDSLLECCRVATLRLAGMSEEELLTIPFVDLTGLCRSVGLRVARRHVEQIAVIRGWRLSRLDDPVLPLEASGGEDEPVSVDGVEEPGFHGGFSLPGSPYPGVAALPTLPVPVSRKRAADFDDSGGLFPLGSDTAAMCKVHKWHHKEAADVFFPYHILAQKHNQNEYNFLHKAGHMAKSVNLADAVEVLSTLQDVLWHIKTRVLMVVTGNAEGWDVAQLLEDKTALVFKVHKDHLHAAHKCAKQVAPKWTAKAATTAPVTSPFFWTAPRPTWGASLASGRTTAASRLGHASAAATQTGRSTNPTVGCFVCGGTHFTHACPKCYNQNE